AGEQREPRRHTQAAALGHLRARFLLLPGARDFRLPAQHAAVVDHETRRDHVADEHAGGLYLQALGDRHLAVERAADEARTGIHVGFDFGAGPEHQLVLVDFDAALDVSVNADVLGAADFSFDRHALTDPGDLTAFG